MLLETRIVRPSLQGIMFFTLLAVIGPANALLKAAPGNVTFSQGAETVQAYDFLEITLNVASPDAKNPFTDASVEAQFGKVGESRPLSVDGFCDSADGSVFRVRLMPSAPGDYNYSITYRQGQFEKTHKGSFRATDGHRRGPVRVDPKYPWHFIWEGTGEHYFFNGTTAFWLMGWRDEATIRYSIERLHRLRPHAEKMFGGFRETRMRRSEDGRAPSPRLVRIRLARDNRLDVRLRTATRQDRDNSSKQRHERPSPHGRGRRPGTPEEGSGISEHGILHLLQNELTLCVCFF